MPHSMIVNVLIRLARLSGDKSSADAKVVAFEEERERRVDVKREQRGVAADGRNQ